MLTTLTDHQPAVGQMPDPNFPKLWRSGRSFMGAGGMAVPDYPHRLAIRRNRLGGRRMGPAQNAIPPHIVMEESYRALLQTGLDPNTAYQRSHEAMMRAAKVTNAVMQAGFKVTGFVDPPGSNFYNSPNLSQYPHPGQQNMTTNNYFGAQTTVHPAAPTFANAQRAGMTAGPGQQIPRSTPRGVMQSGTGTSAASINAARVMSHQARQAIQPQSIMPEARAAVERVNVVREYQSVDGQTYSIQTGNVRPDGTDFRSVPGASVSILMHAFAELIKQGDPLAPLGACIGPFQDHNGNVVMDFRETLTKLMESAVEAEAAQEEELPNDAFAID